MPLDLPWLIDSKLRPNTRPGKHLLRARIARLSDDKDGRFVLIHAPPGYGKTSAMMQLYEAVMARGQRATWLSLDEQDADPYQFFCYLAASFQAAGSDIDYGLPRDPQELSQSSLTFLTDTILNALKQSSSPDYIFLDDFHLAENALTSRIVKRLFTGLNAGTLVLSSRTRPSEMETAGLRAQDQLAEVTKEDLQFSAQDVETYLGDSLEVTNRVAYCTELSHRTEGWPIALQAIRQLILRGISAEQALQQTSGRNTVLTAYFMEQVFNALSQDHQRLLLSTAMFDRVNGDLADAICNTNNAWSLLDELESNDVFVESLDAEHQWYRFHRLFAEFLNERARRDSTIDTLEIARRAAVWHRDNDFAAEALHAAIITGDAVLIAETMDVLGGWRQAMQGNLQSVLRALPHVSQDVLHRYPSVWMADIYAKLKVGEYDAAQGEHQALSQAFKDRFRRDVTLRNDELLIDALLVGYRDQRERLPEMIDQLEQMDPASFKDDNYFQAMRLNSLSFFHFRNGSLSKSIPTAEASIQFYRKAGTIYGEVFLYFHQGFTFYIQGRLRDARLTLEQGMELSAANFGVDSDLYAIGAAYMSLVCYDQNESSAAQKFVDIALPRIEHSDAWTEVYLAAYAVRLALAAAAEDWDGLEAVHLSASTTARTRQLSRVARFVSTYNQTLLRQHERPLPPKLARPDIKLASLTALPFDEFHILAAHARSLIEEEAYEDALQFLAGHVDHAREHQLNRAFITLSLLCAIAHRAKGDLDSAADCFNEALAQAFFEDIKRPIIDEGPVVALLIKDIENRGANERHIRLRDNFLAALLAEINAVHQKPSRGDGILSAREQEVLRNLIHGRSNSEISQVLGISANTVKFHLKNMFQKLGVSSREEAVRLSLRDQLL